MKCATYGPGSGGARQVPGHGHVLRPALLQRSGAARPTPLAGPPAKPLLLARRPSAASKQPAAGAQAGTNWPGCDVCLCRVTLKRRHMLCRWLPAACPGRPCRGCRMPARKRRPSTPRSACWAARESRGSALPCLGRQEAGRRPAVLLEGGRGAGAGATGPPSTAAGAGMLSCWVVEIRVLGRWHEGA